MTEVAPGIHRIESVLGPRPFSQYLLRGERSMLVDTGIASTPVDVIFPFFERVGRDPAELDYVLISHADVDHFGGNGSIRNVAPRATFCAHDLDSDWIGDRARILRERYGWYADHGPDADYDQPTKDFLAGALGEDVPVDLRLQGGEQFRMGPHLTVEVLSLPGHSGGHIGLWDRSSRTAVVMDAVLGGGLCDWTGTIIHPPPYFTASAYEATIARLQALNPQLLLTAHYEPMEGRKVAEFLELSTDFVRRARAAVEATVQRQREVTLAGLLGELAPELGPFTSFANELCGPLRAHLRELVAAGKAEEVSGGQVPAWRWTE
jgi:glyoxylase-like metal-dependent hydrolase (beta-lactamase superfamily II)